MECTSGMPEDKIPGKMYDRKQILGSGKAPDQKVMQLERSGISHRRVLLTSCLYMLRCETPFGFAGLERQKKMITHMMVTFEFARMIDSSDKYFTGLCGCFTNESLPKA